MKEQRLRLRFQLVGFVAFTPKGGCPLKGLALLALEDGLQNDTRSIHPQGWVPVERRQAGDTGRN